MKIAVIGSRALKIKIDDYIPNNVTEIVTGGAKGIDQCAIEFARAQNIKLTIFYPDYKRYRKGAPHHRNTLMAHYADACIAIWDGTSRGTANAISQFKQAGIDVTIISIKDKK